MLNKLYALLKPLLKPVVTYFPKPLTKNEYYDRQTKKIIAKYLAPQNIAIDVGANEGKILEFFCKASPQKHIAFEPIPSLYNSLKTRFCNRAVIYNLALSNTYSQAISFNLVITNAAYSGLLKRPYDKPEKDESIIVETNTLDNVLHGNSMPIGIIKVDVEGAELLVLQGAKNIIKEHKPILLLEFGKKAASIYGYGWEEIWNLIVVQLNYEIYLTKNFLAHQLPLAQRSFEGFYQNEEEYFFVAVPSITK